MKKYKIIEISIIFLILTIVITPNVPSDYKVKTIYVDDNGNKDYQTIKEAIYNAIPGDTIYVYNGTYSEYFAINKSINLIGEDKEKTIIQQNNSVYENYLIKIASENVTISGFTIKDNFYKKIENKTNNPILPSFNDYIGILIESNNNEIHNNTLTNWGYAIIINQSQNIVLSNNNITDNSISCIYIKNSLKNIIINNNINNNKIGIMFDINSTKNLVYHNNFINNAYHHIYSESSNIFYNETLKQGNYYDNYDGMDKNNDGIGDTPYNISGEKNIDLYPLMTPYYGRIIIKNFYVDQESVLRMLWIAMIVTIIFLLPIAYIWYKKTRPRK